MKKVTLVLALSFTALFFLSLSSQKSYASDTVVVGQPYGYGSYGYGGYGGDYGGGYGSNDTVVVGQPYSYGPVPYGPGGGFYAVPYPPYYSSNPVLQNPISVGNPFYLNRYVGGNLRPAQQILNLPNPINRGNFY
jgi:hypothetical protein